MFTESNQMFEHIHFWVLQKNIHFGEGGLWSFLFCKKHTKTAKLSQWIPKLTLQYEYLFYFLNGD